MDAHTRCEGAPTQRRPRIGQEKRDILCHVRTERNVLRAGRETRLSNYYYPLMIMESRQLYARTNISGIEAAHGKSAQVPNMGVYGTWTLFP